MEINYLPSVYACDVFDNWGEQILKVTILATLSRHIITSPAKNEMRKILKTKTENYKFQLLFIGQLIKQFNIVGEYLTFKLCIRVLEYLIFLRETVYGLLLT